MFCALLKLLTTPRATKISVTTIERGSRMRTHRAHQIDPEVPELFILVLRKPPNQRNRDAHSHCATSERLHTETGGQPDMAEGGFARVILPTRVCCKRNGRIER